MLLLLDKGHLFSVTLKLCSFTPWPKLSLTVSCVTISYLLLLPAHMKCAILINAVPSPFFFFRCVYLVMFDFDNLRVSSEFSGINGLFSPPTQREADKYSFFQAIWCNYSRFTISIWSMPQPTKSKVKAFKIRLGSQNPISSSCHTSWLIKHSNNVTDVRLWDVLWISLVF